MFLLSWGLYFMSFYALFQQVHVLSSMAYILAFFIIFHFFYIEIYKYKFRYFICLIAILTAGISVLWGHNNLQIILSIIVMNIGIIMLWYSLNPELKNKIKFDSVSYFLSWWYIFTVWVSIAFWLAIIWFYNKFPFTCQSLDESSDKVIDTVTRPFEIWLEEANKIKITTKEFFGYNVDDVLVLNQEINKKPSIYWNITKQLVNQIQEENIETTMWICEYLLWKVNEKFDKPEYRISVSLLLFLLLYPFVRIVFRIMSFISYLLFKLCYITKIYEVEKIKTEVDKLD